MSERRLNAKLIATLMASVLASASGVYASAYVFMLDAKIRHSNACTNDGSEIFCREESYLIDNDFVRNVMHPANGIDRYVRPDYWQWAVFPTSVGPVAASPGHATGGPSKVIP
jgi:hypothetical protein